MNDPSSGGKRKHDHREGGMLVEVLVSVIILSMVGLALISSVVVSRRLTYANAQRVGAFGLARARLEELKGVRYEDINLAEYPKERKLEFAHRGGVKQKPVEATRITQLTERSDPKCMEAEVIIRWKSQGEKMEERASAFLYPR